MKIGLLALCATFVLLVGCSNTSSGSKDATADAKFDPKTMCPVSGEKLGGDMGPPYLMDYQGRQIKLCCSACEADFKKDPQKYIAKIDGK